MNAFGWIVFLVSNLTVISLIGFCFYRVLAPPRSRVHAQLDLDTRDAEPDDNEGP